MRTRVFFMSAAVFIHLGILLFGGQLFLKPPEEEGATEIAEVDIISDDSQEAEKKKDKDVVQEKRESEEAPQEAMEVQEEAPPSMDDLLALQTDAAAAVPELQALSLDALSGALAPGMTAGDFGFGVNLGSGGRIGGTGTAADAELAAAGGIFDAADLDQKPRTVFQVPPLYPAELRRKKTAGTVYVLFVVDQQGRVLDPKIESSPDAAFERPVIDAVKRWRFEPGSRNGQKVQCKMRLPIRFSAES
jgi:TonB family protein